MSAQANHRKLRGRTTLNSVAPTMDANQAFAERARAVGMKPLANRIRTSMRTAENWLQGRTGPQWKHVREMLQHDDLVCQVLRAANREDLAALVEAKQNAEGLAKMLRRIAAE
jgi:hypothetical protein